LAGRHGIDPLTKWIGMTWEDYDRVRVTVRPELLNRAGLLAGPIAYTMIDYSMGSVLWRERSEDERIATLSISINYVQTAREGDIVCVSELDRRNDRIAVLRSEVRHEDGRLIATAIGSYSIFPAERLKGLESGGPSPGTADGDDA
jgi:uncharacterized protein (TIGR00369 family)